MDIITLDSIVCDYESGYSLKDLSEKYGYCKGNLHYHLNKINVLRKNSLVKVLCLKDDKIIGIFVGLWMGDGSKFMDKGAYAIRIHLDKRRESLAKLIQDMLYRLFKKEHVRFVHQEGNRAMIRFFSKFIYNFIDEYVSYESNKCLTIRLKKQLTNYSLEFLQGLLVGLMLSDGYFKREFVFSSISLALGVQMMFLLRKFGFSPRIGRTVKDRPHPLYRVRLIKKEMLICKDDMNALLIKSYFDADMDELKGYTYKKSF